jgi:repressor LexA
MNPLTKKQKKIYDYVRSFLDEHGYAPSYREIGEYFSLSSVATIAEHINTLKTKGYLDLDPGHARSLQLNAASIADTILSIPLMGTIVAGKPIEAIRTEEAIEIPNDMASPGVFALKVRGDSMVGDGILEGDYVVIEPCPNPKNGDIIVALLENQNATLKRFYKEKDCIRLQPANSNYAPIRTRKITIQGKVKGIIRKF